MSRQYHTANPAYPHPDDDSEPMPWPLDEAIAAALKVLRDPTADQWTRNRAADELEYSRDAQEETQK